MLIVVAVTSALSASVTGASVMGASPLVASGLLAALLAALVAGLLVAVPLISTTPIEWADDSWNPATGCTRVGPECDNCYMFALVETRLGWMNPRYPNGTELTVHPDKLGEAADDFEPARLFVNSMSDWLHESIPDEFVIEQVEAMREAPWHLHMPLTKRAWRLARLGPYVEWPECVMAGVSVGVHEQVVRIEQLRASGAKKTYVSFEPLLESVDPDGDLDLTGIDLAIVGGESGRDTYDDEGEIVGREIVPMEEAWVLEIQAACERSGTAFFFKQWGRYDAEGRDVGKKKAGRLLDGQTWDEQPAWYEGFMREAGLVATHAQIARAEQARASARAAREVAGRREAAEEAEDQAAEAA